MFEINDVLHHTSKMKLLYVEDDLLTRNITSDIFQEFFETIVTAVDGEDGLKKYHAHGDFDLIITDLNMPKYHGLEMIREIREHNKEIPIIVISAHNETEYFVKTIHFNVDGYLIKPIEIEPFLSVLQKIGSKFEMIRTNLYSKSLSDQLFELMNHHAIVSKTDVEGYITYVNDEFCRVSGYTREELLGNKHNIVKHPDNDSVIYDEIWRTITKKGAWQGILRNRSKNGYSYYVDALIKPIVDLEDNIIEYISVRNDVTEIYSPKKHLQEELESFLNPLFVMVKIEAFEELERMYGPCVIEVLEKDIAKIVAEQMCKFFDFDLFFPLGEGEYGLALDMTQHLHPQNHYDKRLKFLQDYVESSTITLSHIDYEVAIVASVALGENVYENAKFGLQYLIKSKESYILSNNLKIDEQKKAKDKLVLLQKIKSAIADNRVLSYFQPIVSNDTRDIVKYESLVRILDADGTLLFPNDFLEIAKESKYFAYITERVLENSFHALKKTTKKISINLSVLDIEKSETREKIITLLTQCEVPHRIVFELLEDEAIKDIKVIQKFILQVKKLGVRIAIDDFGVGYSSFERLIHYHPDIVKIDSSLIKNITQSPYALSVVKTILAFAKEQKIQTVAEYVEDEATFTLLKSIGVDYSQGYLFGKPEPLSI